MYMMKFKICRFAEFTSNVYVQQTRMRSERSSNERSKRGNMYWHGMWMCVKLGIIDIFMSFWWSRLMPHWILSSQEFIFNSCINHDLRCKISLNTLKIQNMKLPHSLTYNLEYHLSKTSNIYFYCFKLILFLCQI